MTLLDIVSKVSGSNRITVVKRTSDEILIDTKAPDDIMDSHRFHAELAGLEVCGLGVGDFCDLVVTVE